MYEKAFIFAAYIATILVTLKKQISKGGLMICFLNGE